MILLRPSTNQQGRGLRYLGYGVLGMGQALRALHAVVSTILPCVYSTRYGTWYPRGGRVRRHPGASASGYDKISGRVASCISHKERRR